jgi:type III restriction enzyme
MAGFNFEKNLLHQQKAVDAVVDVFKDLEVHPATSPEKNHANPSFADRTGGQYTYNIDTIQRKAGIREKGVWQGRILDIMMETGTGKTYTYTKTMFELNKRYGVFKFVIVVPTLSIKAGTVDFLRSVSAREHFKEQYGKTIALHVVESVKGGKGKKSFFPMAVSTFVQAGVFEKNQIQVLVINAGMLNSETMQKSFDTGMFDRYTVPFEALGVTNAFVIVDEPHKFTKENKTWENIQKMKPHYILRYGATFPEYENLIYKLTAVDSFKQNLVKGVLGHITEYETGKNVRVKFLRSDGHEAHFELVGEGEKKTYALGKGESLERIHSAMTDLYIETMNKRVVVLSNGLELSSGASINPYAYAETLQEVMIQKAVKNHFLLEKEMLQREVKIKPLTLFFIDRIEEYRSADGYVRKMVESAIRREATALLATDIGDFYRAYLEKTLADVSKTHGGYFSKDNSEKDEAIEQEVYEILHDKAQMLSLENPRRFIFSKWTLREGWDNPNVFQICKLRSSGSEISRLQEVGRGLRLPVNEYGNRVKDEQFYLNYFVDFTESDFVEKLVQEVNQKSGALSFEEEPTKISELMIQKILEQYPERFRNENELMQKLIVDEKVVDFSHTFLKDKFSFIREQFPLIFEGVGSDKVRVSGAQKKTVSVRVEKYAELKDLWEQLNQKVVLEYNIANEETFKNLLVDFLKKNAGIFGKNGVVDMQKRVHVEGDLAEVHTEVLVPAEEVRALVSMRYDEFLLHLSRALASTKKTVHDALVEAGACINDYRNMTTVRLLKQGFEEYLLAVSFDAFEVAYKKVANTCHPTALTDEKGEVLREVPSFGVGVIPSHEKVADAYLFKELFFDSELEKENMRENIREVVVFTKIPRKSIKIPVVGGKSYSPDFAYVIDFNDGKKKLYFVVETKNKTEAGLVREEAKKIRHAERFFGGAVAVQFKTQFEGDTIARIIGELRG